MLTIQTILDQLTGNGIADAMEGIMAKHFADFADAKKQFSAAIAALQSSLGNDATICVEDEVRAIRQQTASDLLFSGLLGLKANLDHFIDPIARTFLEVEPEIYLREETAHKLPAYAGAQLRRELFYAQLSPQQQKIYEHIAAYTCYMETVGPKLAHYYGYILGNQLLPQVVPGYHPDNLLTMGYTAMLNRHFGQPFLSIQAQ